MSDGWCSWCAAELKQATTAAAAVELSDHLIEVVFALFDEDSKFFGLFVCLSFCWFREGRLDIVAS